MYMQQFEDKVLTEVTTRIDALSAKLGAGVDHLWPALVRFQFAGAVGNLFILVLLALVFSVVLKQATKHEWGKHGDPTIAGVLGVLSLVGLCLTMIGLLVNVSSDIATIASPEASALRAIMSK